ncbi:prolyl oligopeptidase family serine peptidase [Streptomyces sp. NBC_01304]|uniref:prolyl oligopeptidase family serine peptidase n=1 Tax=Streptomyces sp. NBC_01304 TaxID=2903818 RepID=UPI002E101C9B|nr:prolyl oligopeptidase family serine peptidase [Streptomyces sp. NBC_01304]
MESSAPIDRFPLQFARTRRFSLGTPRAFTVSPDGERVLFLRSTGGEDPVSRLWEYDVVSGEERMLADPSALGGNGPVPEAERIRRERAREFSDGVVGYAVDRHARVVAFALGGALWVLPADGPGPVRVPTAGPVVDPRPSPDGSLVAYVTGGALHVVRVDGTDDRLLAAPEADDVTYGLSDHTAAESLGRPRAHWWAPDGSALLVARVDTSPVRRWYLSDPAHPERAPRAIRFPAAGTANSRTSLHILGLDGSRTDVRMPEEPAAGTHPEGVWTDPAFEYVTTAAWDGHGPLISLQTRDQRSACTFAVDPATGGCELLHHQRDLAWADQLPGTPARTAAGALIVPWSEGDSRGLRVGEARTPHGLQVGEVLSVAGDRVVFTASEEPTEVHSWSYAPDEGFVRISEEPGVHFAEPGGPTLVLDSLTFEGRQVRVRRDGKATGQIAVRTQEPLVKAAPLHLRLGERELRSALYLPTGYAPGSGRLPVLLDPYAGPGHRVVLRGRTWSATVSQWFADQGFAVLVTDGRGTPGRGRDWETSIHGDTLGPVLEDQVDALHAAAERCPDLDLERVAIRGWSFGGFLAAGAVLHRPDVFHAAVAGAPPTDQRLYDTFWKERFLGHPDVTPEHYDRCSLVPYADRLTRPLLLIQGLADDNVVPAHTFRFSAALLAAGRPHQVLPLATATHAANGEGVADALLLHQLDFLKTALNL